MSIDRITLENERAVHQKSYVKITDTTGDLRPFTQKNIRTGAEVTVSKYAQLVHVINGSGGGGSTSDTTAANQVIANTLLTSIRDNADQIEPKLDGIKIAIDENKVEVIKVGVDLKAEMDASQVLITDTNTKLDTLIAQNKSEFDETQLKLDALIDQGKVGTHVRETGNQNSLPTGNWSNLIIRMDRNNTQVAFVSGFDLIRGETWAASANDGSVISTPTIVNANSQNFKWEGLRQIV